MEWAGSGNVRVKTAPCEMWLARLEYRKCKGRRLQDREFWVKVWSLVEGYIWRVVEGWSVVRRRDRCIVGPGDTAGEGECRGAR